MQNGEILEKSTGDSRFWTIGLILLSRSTSFRMAQLIQTHPKWYKDMTIEEVFKLLKEYNRLGRRREKIYPSLSTRVSGSAKIYYIKRKCTRWSNF